MTDPTSPAPAALQARHLVHALVPVGDAADADPRVPLLASLHRIDMMLLLADALAVRLPQLPAPPRQTSLQELVAAARRRLRDDHGRTDTEELGVRRFVVSRVVEELGR